jgi:hypothetical protein
VAEELSRTELRRVAEEFKSERDAAKRDAMRAFDERNALLHEMTQLKARADAARSEAIEDAARICFNVSCSYVDEYPTGHDPYVAACDRCANAIRALANASPSVATAVPESTDAASD